MLLLDSSVWIEVLRGRLALMTVPTEPGGWVTTEPVMLEVLAGAVEFDRVQARLEALPLRTVEPHLDYLSAAAIYRAARRQGLTIRSLTDCLIAAIALRGNDIVVHRDADFESIARVCDLRTIDLR